VHNGNINGNSNNGDSNNGNSKPETHARQTRE
jgi:hypothetical protein